MRIFLFLLSLFAAAGTADAAYVIDTGPGTSTAPYVVGPQFGTYGQFTLTQATRIGGIQFYGTITNPGTALFNLSFGGTNAPGTFIFTQTMSFGTAAGEGWHGLSDLDLELGPGTYWVGFASGGDGFAAQHYGSAPNPLGNEAYYTPLGGYTDADNANLAWRISSVAAGAPEPAAWAMMILGFGAVGASLRRARSAGFATA
ncbi:MAG TPA: PEPxxWA-CTERM sorting domain-containing protein [Allosphingosinicella sp.]|jgi:hypothetical protein